MILDYYFHKQKHQFSVSYITENGGKNVLKYNVSRFKSFVEDPHGQFDNWNGKKCSPRMVDKPGWTEYKTFLEELPENDKKLILAKNNPRLYTFDIEVEVKQDEFPEPEFAKFPVLTISIVNDKMDAMVLGVKKLNDPERLQQRYEEWLNTVEFYRNLKLPRPKAQYIYFETERDMLKYFLVNIVSKCPVLAGWNSLTFDWYYLQQRVKLYYPDLSFNSCSIDWTTSGKMVQDFKGNKIRLNMPNHTLVLDMMDIIGTFDMAVMPIKENLSLDYISTESIGVGKIKYDGDLQQLYERDYATYVFYNMIDSVLVQLIDKRFNTLSIMYGQSLLIRNRISAAFSKIALAESLFFNHWYENGIKIVPQEKFSGERGELVGAYVRVPTPGKHKYIFCFDFSALYPNSGRTSNISPENFLGCIENGVFTEEDIERYKKDPNYYVTVNNCVYKNDRDYALKQIWTKLQEVRSTSKYTAKQLDATVMSDIEHIEKNSKPTNQRYNDNCVRALSEIGFDIKCTNDLYNVDIQELRRLLKLEIDYLVCCDLSAKIAANGIYGGLSHVANEFYDIYVANSITAEGRNLIHLMEEHIPKFFQENWHKMTDVHKKLGIKLKKY